jgi:hypothetical protein
MKPGPRSLDSFCPDVRLREDPKIRGCNFPVRWRESENVHANVSPDTGKRWSQDIPGNIARADDNWPQIKDKTPKELE